MTDNRTTELREGLTKRGIVYRTTEVHGMPVTTYKSDVLTWNATEHSDGNLVLSCVGVTPEQAIAATLGSEREKTLEELVRDAYWLIVRADWTHESQDQFAFDWTERVAVLGIEVD